MKTCRVCGNKFESTAPGNRCRSCYNDYMRLYMNERYVRRREDYINSQGRVCSDCGESSDSFEIDHVEQYGKKIKLGQAFASLAKSKLEEELKKCQILCPPCHQKKTRKDLAVRFNQREHWEHGTLGGHRYCNCVSCKKAWSEYNKMYRARKKLENDSGAVSIDGDAL